MKEVVRAERSDEHWAALKAGLMEDVMAVSWAVKMAACSVGPRASCSVVMTVEPMAASMVVETVAYSAGSMVACSVAMRADLLGVEKAAMWVATKAE